MTSIPSDMNNKSVNVMTESSYLISGHEWVLQTVAYWPWWWWGKRMSLSVWWENSLPCFIWTWECEQQDCEILIGATILGSGFEWELDRVWFGWRHACPGTGNIAPTGTSTESRSQQLQDSSWATALSEWYLDRRMMSIGLAPISNAEQKSWDLRRVFRKLTKEEENREAGSQFIPFEFNTSSPKGHTQLEAAEDCPWKKWRSRN